jgi:hypothetical protein
MMEKMPVDILEAVAIELSCVACKGRYEVTLKQVLLSQQMLHDGCPVPPSFTSECPPLHYADFADHDLIRELERIWLQLEESVRAAGGELLLHASRAQ